MGAAILAAVLGAAVGQVAPRSDALEKTAAHIDAGDFEDAVKAATAGLEGGELSDDQLVEMYRLLGLAQLYLGDEEKARDAYQKLLQARPDYELPKSSPPKIRALYARIKDDVKKRRVRPVTLTVAGLGDVAGDSPLEVPAHIEELGLGAKAKLYFRRSGAQAFGSVDFVRVKGAPKEYLATVPAFELPRERAAYEIEYYVEVTDAARRRLAGRGDAYGPLTFHVLAKPAEVAAGPAPVPWFKSPWVWLGIGAGVAAATTGVVVIATQTQTATVRVTIQIDGTP